MRLYLIRHAESQNNAQPERYRVEDPPLSERGSQQAEQLGRWLEDFSVDHFITSPFLRTLHTTRAILQYRDLDVHVWHNIFEQGGCFRGYGPETTEGGPGLGPTSILAELAITPERCHIDPSIDDRGWWFGRRRETAEEAVLRVKETVARFENAFGNQQISVIAIVHADFKRLFLTEILAPHFDASLLGGIRNTAITKVDFDGKSWQLDWFNSISHLPAQLIGQGEGNV